MRKIGDERGQAMVEMALVGFFLLVPLVAGIIQFGVALNYWLDLNRIANQGARWAVVNEYPLPGGGWCARDTSPAGSCTPTLQQYLESEPVSGGLDPCVNITLPNGAGAGRPVNVYLEKKMTLVPILGIGELTLRGEASMRQEWTATQFTTTENTC